MNGVVGVEQGHFGILRFGVFEILGFGDFGILGFGDYAAFETLDFQDLGIQEVWGFGF